MRWFNKKLTQECEFILKKAHLKNTESNQRLISGLLGFIAGYILWIISA